MTWWSHLAAKTCAATKNAIKPIFEDASHLRILRRCLSTHYLSWNRLVRPSYYVNICKNNTLTLSRISVHPKLSGKKALPLSEVHTGMQVSGGSMGEGLEGSASLPPHTHTYQTWHLLRTEIHTSTEIKHVDRSTGLHDSYPRVLFS